MYILTLKDGSIKILPVSQISYQGESLKKIKSNQGESICQKKKGYQGESLYYFKINEKIKNKSIYYIL